MRRPPSIAALASLLRLTFGCALLALNNFRTETHGCVRGRCRACMRRARLLQAMCRW